MIRLRNHLASISGGLLLACSVWVYPAFSTPEKIVLKSIQILPTLEGVAVEVQSNEPFDFITYTLTDPDRLILDPVEPVVESSLPEPSPLSGGLVTSWSVFKPPGAGSSNEVDYISFELAKPAEHLVELNAGKLVLQVRPKERPYPGLSIAAADLTDAGPPDLPDSPEPSDSAGPAPELWSLETALNFGLNRHRPVQIAREEMELAQMKLREAHRALYPAATLKTSWTTGTASNIGFREASHGLQLEHPLFYSGRLIETYKQALVNLQVAEKRQAKVKADFSLEAAQAYFQLIGAKTTLAAQEGLAIEAQEHSRRAQARFDKGLLNRLELLNIQAQVNQAKFQQTVAQSDVSLARIKFLQRMNLGPQAQVEVASQFPPYVPLEIDLKEAQDLAVQFRPDVQVNRLLVEFHEYEERIAKTKGKLKVDLSGFIGSSGSAFETEPLSLGTDYFVGIKATEALGTHGATASITKTHTSPRLGQTTRTDSTVYSAEVGLVNQLQGLSEVQQAHIGLTKAINDLEEAKASIFQEVQEAYVSYAKAKLQSEYAKQKINFRQEQVKILQAQASLNEALPSQVLEAVMKLTEERVGEAQALANYYVALAKLNKAIGLPNHYR